MVAYGLGLVRLSVCPCIRPQPYLVHVWTNFVQTWYNDNTWRYTNAHYFVSRFVQKWLTGGHFICKNQMLNTSLTIYRTCIYLFKLGTHLRNDGLHTCVILFWDQIQDGWLEAILLLKRVPNHFSDMYGPIIFVLGTKTTHDGVRMCAICYDITSKMADWRPF